MSRQLQLALLGKPQIKRDGEPLNHLVSVKAQALLFYLAVTGQPHSRSSLAGLLWAEMPEDTAKANLRLTLARLRKSLAAHLTATRQSIAFNFAEPHWLDMNHFEAYAIKPASHDMVQLRDAVSLYRGDFLDDFNVPNAPIFDEWVVAERERLQQLALTALFLLTNESAQRGDLAEGVKLTRRILFIEPWLEEAHQQLMWLLANNGQRTAALTQYKICRQVLAEELGIEPAPATMTLFEQIKAGDGSPLIGEPFALPYLQVPLHNIPAETTPLIGRETEQAELADLLSKQESRLVTLVGPGGIGKTRLALAAAASQIDAFHEGVWFVPLEGVMPARSDEAAELVIAGIANTLNYSFAAQQPPRMLLLKHLADKEMLLLLDNFEQLRPATDLLINILHHAPGVKLLLTSRERLGVRAEWLFDVEGLSYPPAENGERGALFPAVQLFNQSARRIKPDFKLAEEENAVGRICQLVEGFPLGIELAANWVRALSCVDIASRIESSLDLLATNSSDMPERHRNMRAVLDYSWNVMSDEERQVFRRLSVFYGGFERAASRKAAGASLSILANLVDKSLLRRSGRDRYQMHELLRLYAAEQLEGLPDELAAAREAHGQYYADFLETRKSALEHHAERDLTVIDREAENLRTAWEWVVAGGEVNTVASFLDGLWLYYRSKGWFQEAVYVLQQVITLGDVPVSHMARWQRLLGFAYYEMGQLAESETHLRLALGLLDKPIPGSSLGMMTGLLAQIVQQISHRLWPAYFVGRLQKAKDSLLEASLAYWQLFFVVGVRGSEVISSTYAGLRSLNLAEEAGPSPELARSYATGAAAMAVVPLRSLVQAYLSMAQATIQKEPDASVETWILVITGTIAITFGRLPEAANALGRGAEIAARIRQLRRWDECTSGVAVARFHQGALTVSRRLCHELYRSARRRGDPQVQAWALCGQAAITLRLGTESHANEALALLEEAEDVLAEYRGIQDEIWLYGMLARAHWHKGEQRLAWRAAEKATIRIATSGLAKMFYTIEGYAGSPAIHLAAWEAHDENQPVIADRQSVQKLAKRDCQDLHSFAKVVLLARPRAWMYQGLYDWLAGKPRKAHKAWWKSLGYGERFDMPWEQARTHYEIGRHLELGDTSRLVHLTRAVEIFTQLDAAYDLARAQSALDMAAR